MTLSPLDDKLVRGVDGPDYKVGPYCSNPECMRIVEHVHHIWRRSQLGGPYDWVDVHGHLIANKTGLCPICHDEVTGEIGGHKAAIRYDVEDDAFSWCTVHTLPNGEIEFHEVGPLDPQPPSPSTLAARASGHAHSSTACPFCGQTRRRRPAPGSHRPGRRRKTWNVPVPEEERENGAAVLDALVQDLGPLLGYGTDAGARYYVLVPVLYYAQQNRRAFVESLSGVGA